MITRDADLMMIVNSNQHGTGRHRGATTAGVLAMTFSFGVLGATAVMIGPRVIEAQSAVHAPYVIAASDPAHQRVIELFGSMVARSRAVLAVHQRGATPYEELVLWFEDRDRPDQVDRHEVGVISHSRILRTLTFFTQESAEIAPAAFDEPWHEASFCDAWRTHPDRQAVVIASGISDLHYDYVQLIQGEAPSLRITFTWASESADGSDEASIVVDVSNMLRQEDGGAGVRRHAS